jgi:hypothetical protein
VSNYLSEKEVTWSVPYCYSQNISYFARMSSPPPKPAAEAETNRQRKAQKRRRKEQGSLQLGSRYLIKFPSQADTGAISLRE